MARKTPILLRRGPITGHINALTNYRHTNGHIRVANDGKHDVSADFDSLVLTEFLDDAPDIALILDIVQQGYGPDTLAEDVPTYKDQVEAFRKALVTMIERHNARLGKND